MNFITKHIIAKIEDLVIRKQRSLKCDGFFYFDDLVKDTRIVINRINRWNVFAKEEILPISWHMLDSRTLITIFHRLKNNQFFGYRRIDGKDFKVRIKDEHSRI